jgi:hypothetical protein
MKEEGKENVVKKITRRGERGGGAGGKAQDGV